MADSGAAEEAQPEEVVEQTAEDQDAPQGHECRQGWLVSEDVLQALADEATLQALADEVSEHAELAEAPGEAAPQAAAEPQRCAAGNGWVPSERSLGDVLREARPSWTPQDVAAVERKLRHLGISSGGELEEALGEQLNERLRKAGFKAFSAETMQALQCGLAAQGGQQHDETCAAPPVVPDFQRPLPLGAAEESLLGGFGTDGVPRGRCGGCSDCPCCVSGSSTLVRWVAAEAEREKEDDAEEKLAVGDRVEVRADGAETWRPGAVTCLEPLRVRPDGGGDEEAGTTWKMVRRVGARQSSAREEDPAKSCEVCARCGCDVTEHEDLHLWHSRVRLALVKFRSPKTTSLKVPQQSAVPAAAVEWEPADVALNVLTGGVFDPRCDSRISDPGSAAAAATGGVLISVVTPTSEARQDFHPLLYECFRSQRHEPKELVVVDTGTRPSVFLQERARLDARVVYRFWSVADARVQDLSECVMDHWEESPGPARRLGLGGAWRPWQACSPVLAPWSRRPPPNPQHSEAKRDTDRLRCRLHGRVRGGARREGWSLGMKRNIACHLAKGDVIAHFDDDDLYAPQYLEAMLEKLREASGPPNACGRMPAAAVTLEAWHVLDMADQTFGFFRPRADPLLGKEQAESFAHGFGFSYVYTKAAWEISPFADVEWSEDGVFTDALMRKGKVVKLVNPEMIKKADALAAHSHHSETTSGGEFVEMVTTDFGGRQGAQYSVRMGTKVGAPEALKGLLPLVRQIVSKRDIKKGRVHPVRQNIAERPITSEVGLQEKQGFVLRYNMELGKNGAGGKGGPRSPELVGKGKGKSKGKGKGKGRLSHWMIQSAPGVVTWPN